MATFDRLSLILDCLCQQIEDDGSPPVCFCEVVPGEAAAADYFNCAGACTGMAWVRLVTAYPATTVGSPDVEVGNCGKETGLEIELGIMRCQQSLMPSDGRPVPPKAVREAAAQQMLDMETMMRTIVCCPTVSGKDFVVGAYIPIGPEGGIVGGMLTVSLI